MDTSKLLSKIIGPYFIIVAVAMLVNMHQFINSVTLLIHDDPLMLVTGYFTLIIGLLMVVNHNIWQWNWKIIITLTAWLILLKGISIILFPQLIEQTTIVYLKNSSVQYFAAYFDFFIGVVLSYFGFKHNGT